MERTLVAAHTNARIAKASKLLEAIGDLDDPQIACSPRQVGVYVGLDGGNGRPATGLGGVTMKAARHR